jgi:type II secretory pathway pseudopilin PulG
MSLSTPARRNAETPRSAFTLIELIVIMVIIAIMMALLLPAVQRVRQSSWTSACSNNLRQLAEATFAYNQTNERFPYGRKYDVWNTYTWTELILPFIDQQNLAALYGPSLQTSAYAATAPGPNGPQGDPSLAAARATKVPVFLCPADLGFLVDQETDNLNCSARGNYRGCSGTGDMYGSVIPGVDPTPPSAIPASGPGMFGVVANPTIMAGATPALGIKAHQVPDGLSNTLLYSEGLEPSLRITAAGPIGLMWYGNMGSALFSTSLTPNSSANDNIWGVCPGTIPLPGDGAYPAPCASKAPTVAAFTANDGVGAYAAARSYHHGGVNAAYADGSVHFIRDNVDLNVWRALGTRSGGQGDAGFDPP